MHCDVYETDCSSQPRQASVSLPLKSVSGEEVIKALTSPASNLFMILTALSTEGNFRDRDLGLFLSIKFTTKWDVWVVQLVKLPPVVFGSGCDLTGCEIKTCIWLCARQEVCLKILFLSPSSPPQTRVLSLTFSKINKSIF